MFRKETYKRRKLHFLWTGPQSGWVGKGQFTKFYCYDEWQPPEKKFKWEVGKMAVGVHKQ